MPSADEIKLICDEAVSTCSNGAYKYGNAAFKSAKTKDSRRRIFMPDKAFEAILHFRKYYESDDGFVCVNDKNQNHYTRQLVERTLARIVQNSQCRDKQDAVMK